MRLTILRTIATVALFCGACAVGGMLGPAKAAGNAITVTIPGVTTATVPVDLPGTTTSSSGHGSTGGPSGASGPGARTVHISEVKPPNHLVIAQARFSRKVLRDRAPFVLDVWVKDAEGRLVQGATVGVVAVPAGRTQKVPARLTSAAGTAHLVVQPTKRLPIVKGGRLALYVRAWSPKASGSTPVAKRLISIRVSK
jgi:hypothetical protein